MQLVWDHTLDWLPIAAVEGGRPCPLPPLHLGSRKDIRGWVDSKRQPSMGATKALRPPWMDVDGHEGVGGAFRGHSFCPGAAL